MRRSTLIGTTVCLALAGCGGGAVTTVERTVTTRVTVTEAAVPSPPVTASGEGGATSDGSTTTSAQKPTGEVITVGVPVVVYLPNQVDGPYHEAFAVIRNDTGRTARIDAQFSMTDAKGLDGTADASTTIFAGEEGVLVADAVRLPRAFARGEVSLVTSAGEAYLADDAPTDPAAIRIDHASLRPGGVFDTCEYRARVTNTTATKRSLRIVLAAFRGRQVVSVGATYEDLFPKTPKIVDIQMTSKAMCPPAVDEVKGYWEPS